MSFDSENKLILNSGVEQILRKTIFVFAENRSKLQRRINKKLNLRWMIDTYSMPIILQKKAIGYKNARALYLSNCTTEFKF